MGLVGCRHIDGVDAREQLVERVGREGDVELPRQRLGRVELAGPHAHQLDAAHQARLGNERARHPPRADDAQAKRPEGALADHAGRDALGAREVGHVAVLPEVVELAGPVGPKDHLVDAQADDVLLLLAIVVLDDDLVGIARGAHARHSLLEGLDGVELAALGIEDVGGHAHREVVATLAGPPQDVLVAFVVEVEGAIDQDAPWSLLWCDRAFERDRRPILDPPGARKVPRSLPRGGQRHVVLSVDAREVLVPAPHHAEVPSLERHALELAEGVGIHALARTGKPPGDASHVLGGAPGK